MRVVRSLARNIATLVALRVIAVDAGGADGALKDETVRGYLDALAQLMIIEDQPPWATHLRSKSILRNASKRHFVDPSLAVAALRITPERVDTRKCGSPALLGVIVGTGYGYVRKDGVAVIPVG